MKRPKLGIHEYGRGRGPLGKFGWPANPAPDARFARIRDLASDEGLVPSYALRLIAEIATEACDAPYKAPEPEPLPETPNAEQAAPKDGPSAPPPPKRVVRGC